MFDSIPLAPQDPIFGLLAAFNADPRENKINLSVGNYKTEELKPYLFPSVKKAEKELYTLETHKEYLPISGDPGFLQEVKKLVFGKESFHLASVQSIGGTGALKLGAELLSQFFPHYKLFISNPTWDNHRRIFSKARLDVQEYPYVKGQQFDHQGFIAFIKTLAPSLLLLQPSCHNPTGITPNLEEWQEILDEIQRKRHLPFFDFAYQGMGEGLEKDAEVVRLFAKRGVPFLVATSYSKNFGLYAERVGALFVHTETAEAKERVESQLKVIIRASYSNPPCHGARLISHILQNESLKVEWEKELEAIRARLNALRMRLAKGLSEKTQRDYSFLDKQRGMFAYLGLPDEEVERLIALKGLYMLKGGRINLAGLNSNNLPLVIQTISEL